jgi:hypothetical protein
VPVYPPDPRKLKKDISVSDAVYLYNSRYITRCKRTLLQGHCTSQASGLLLQLPPAGMHVTVTTVAAIHYTAKQSSSSYQHEHAGELAVLN